MKLQKITISNYRSINKIVIEIDEKEGLISFAGANNVGKTNIINALALFFEKIKYIPEKDCPYHKFYGTRGGHYRPKIQLLFSDGKNTYDIIKDWNLKKSESEKNIIYTLSGKKNKNKITEKDTLKLLKSINFFFLPSINISFPEAIKYIMNSDVIDIETGNTRLSGKKGEMKKSIESTLKDLQEILDSLGKNISPLLEKYKDGWGVAFDIPKEVNTFRDLMIGEIDFYIKDKSNSKAIDAKGAGLQRLSHILMYFRIIDKLNDKKKNTIIAIDEPDVYLHPGLQKKLLNDIYSRSNQNQFFVTTHSSIFIDTTKLSNVFLLDQNIESKEYQRANSGKSARKFQAISTSLVDLREENGISKLKEHLGLDDTDNLLFDKYNILVEGDEDKIYLQKIGKVFGIELPNIISVGGADNMKKYLDFYDSMSEKEDGVTFLALLDNDSKGRDVYKKIKPESYSNITLKKRIIISFSGLSFDEKKSVDNNTNIEIEDFLNPRIICYLVNKILTEKNLVTLSKKDINLISSNIMKPAFQNSGILQLVESEKNRLNPEHGQLLKINGQGVKGGMSHMFKKLDAEVIKLIGSRDDACNKNIVDFLEEISVI